ncbi:MAG: hypothetical protein L0Y72_14850 [Gemmataceae bacterium]|nr:hypothetical protein [Gemmataceae bacterium]MCI0740321.1 hypothetical protein [Gemmataceae bacterium]
MIAPVESLPATQSGDRLTGSSGGADDPRVVAAVQEYLAALEEGIRPDRVQFLARYHDIAPALATCLDALEFVPAAAPALSQADGHHGSAEVQVGLQLGDYRIVREIGRGGMGVVYEAQQVSLGRRVALKVLPFAAALDAKQLQRFKKESQAAALLHHQHIVPEYAVGSAPGVRHRRPGNQSMGCGHRAAAVEREGARHAPHEHGLHSAGASSSMYLRRSARQGTLLG